MEVSTSACQPQSTLTQIFQQKLSSFYCRLWFQLMLFVPGLKFVLPRVKAWGVGSKHVLHHVTSVNIVFVFVNSIVCVWMFISSVTKSERQIERVRSKHVPPHVTSVVGCLHFQPSSENAVTDVWTCSWLKRQTKVSLKYSKVPQSVSSSKCQ